MTDMIPPSMLPYLETIGKALGGVILIFLGLSFGYKFIQASFMGKVNYWGGLEKVHWMFTPFSVFVTPFFVHTPPKDTNLIKTRTAGWVHLFWGPVFFLTSLMMVVSGADFIGLPGTLLMNWVLTAGNDKIPPAITYQPPFSYKFPILKKARKTLAKLLTADIYLDKNKKLNPFDDSKNIKLWEDDEEDKAEAEQERQAALKAQQSSPQTGQPPAQKK